MASLSPTDPPHATSGGAASAATAAHASSPSPNPLSSSRPETDAAAGGGCALSPITLAESPGSVDTSAAPATLNRGISSCGEGWLGSPTWPSAILSMPKNVGNSKPAVRLARGADFRGENPKRARAHLDFQSGRRRRVSSRRSQRVARTAAITLIMLSEKYDPRISRIGLGGRL